jgi:hypothetical protein
MGKVRREGVNPLFFNTKKNKKLFKKVLTNRSKCGIILSERKRGNTKFLTTIN